MDSINEGYHAMQGELRAHWLSEKSMLLQQALEESTAQQALNECLELDYERSDVPDLHRYSAAKATPELKELMKACIGFLGLQAPSQVRVLRMIAGDYLLAHDQQPDGIHAYIFLSNHWPLENRGELTYLPGDGNAIIIPPAHNTFVLIEPQRMRRFIKRVTYHAGTDQLFIIEALINTGIN